jgi:hypothetical protein
VLVIEGSIPSENINCDCYWTGPTGVAAVP